MANHVVRQREAGEDSKRPARRHSFMKVVLSFIVVLALAGATTFAVESHDADTTKPPHIVQQTKAAADTKAGNSSKSTPTTTASAPNPCANNTLPQLALVSISQRHLWACDETTEEYNSPVVTGIEYLAADLTPVGTYHIFGKETDVYLKGCDSTGCWNDFVNYWMPWLTNQYGTYGFHDATWRQPDAFGNISDESSDASHGCVELPLATAKWLYGWAQVGTTVQIES